MLYINFLNGKFVNNVCKNYPYVNCLNAKEFALSHWLGLIQITDAQLFFEVPDCRLSDLIPQISTECQRVSSEFLQ